MYDNKQITKVVNVLKKNKTNYWSGIECKKFEKEFSKYHNLKYSVAVSNGSVALEIALKALKLSQKDKVIVTPRSFIISASCVLNLGLEPIFADVDNNGNLSIDGISKVFNKSVKAIIVVHLNGLACDMDPIINFVKKKNIFLIEDCSQAHGAIYKGAKVGSFGHFSTWSFCQDKIISTGGEGGMISTNNKQLWLKCWSLKDHGKNYNSVFNKKHKIGFKWLHDDLGSNYRMTEIQATIGREQLKLLDKLIYKRNVIANLYIRGLRDYFSKFNILEEPDFKCQTCPFKNKYNKCKKCLHAFYRLNLFLKKNKLNQLKLIQQLNKKNISCSIGSCPEIYKEKVFRKLGFIPKKYLTNANKLGKTSIMFNINPYKSLISIKKEVNNIKKVLKNIIN